MDNVENLMAFRETGGVQLTLAQIAARYPIVPDGTLTYYGFVDETVRHFQVTGSALTDAHRAVVLDVLDTLVNGDRVHSTFELVVEPAESGSPYAFVAANRGLVERLAIELESYRAEASTAGKYLRILLRYASEMNDSGQIQGGHPDAFRASFVDVRRIFWERAPGVLFPFSPAIRADLDVGAIGDYWPGAEFVDVVGATWFVHGESQWASASANLRAYFLNPPASDKPFAIDEFGGAEGVGDGGPGSVYEHNDAMLEKMFGELRGLALDGVTFDYGTILLDPEKYGVDATLGFLVR